MAIDWNKAMSSSESNKKKKSEIDWEKAGAYSKEKLDSFSRYEKKTTTSKPTTSVPKNKSYKPKQSSGIENKYSKIRPEKKTDKSEKKTDKSVQKQLYANANKRATGYVDMKADEHLASVRSKAESVTDGEREKFLAEYISKPNKDMSASDVVLKQNQAKSKKAWDEEKAEYKATRKQGVTDKTTEYKDKFYDMSYEERKLIGLGDEESLDTLKSEYGYTDDDITAMTYFYNRHVNKKKARQEEINARVKMEQHPFLESVASVPMGLAGGVASLGGIVDSYFDNKRIAKLGIEDQGLDYNHQLGSWQRQAQAGRQEFMDTHLGDMLYSTAMSGLESATAAVIPGGAVLLGVNAGTSKANELAQRGLSSEQAINGGIVAGVVEGLFEKYSIGKLKKLQDVPVHTVKDLVTNIGKSMVTNFQEEAATELANIIYDSIAHGDKSEYQTEVNNFVASGEFTEEEAQKEAFIRQVLQVIEAGASGALMGGVMGGAASGIAYETDYRDRKAIGQVIKESGYAEDVVKEARQSNDKAVQEWVKRINKTDKTTGQVNVKDADLGGAFRALVESDKRETVETNNESVESSTESIENKSLTSEERVEISNPTLESKDGKVVSVASVENVGNGEITVKDSDGTTRKLDVNKLEGTAKSLWNYASTHFKDAKAVESFINSYEGGNVESYSRIYKGVFDLASVGMSAEKIVSENIFEHRVLGEKAFKSAVESGHTAMTYKAGVVDLTTEKKSKSQELTMKIADSFGKRHGMNIVFVDTLGNREGFLTQGKNQIVVALDASGGAISRTLGHETFHYVKIESPEQAKQITDFVVDTMTRLKGAEWVESRYEFYAGQGYESRDAQIEEFVADQMFEVFSSERAVKEFVAQDMNLAQKVISHIKDAIAEIKSIIKKLVSTGRYEDIKAWEEDVDALEKLNNMMLDALSDIEQRKNVTSQEQQFIDALGNELGEVETNDEGKVTLVTNEDESVVISSHVTWDNGGRADLEKALKRNGYNATEVSDIVDSVEEIADFLENMAKDYAENKSYSVLQEHLMADITMDVKNGKAVLHSIVNNGDYPVNIDLALNCKKRVAYMRVMRDLINNGIFESVKYDGDAIAKVNEILRKNGFETACLGCFVESRRLQFQAWAETIVQEWNNAVDMVNKNAEYFGYAKVQKGASALTEEEIVMLDRDLSSAERNEQGNVKLKGRTIEGKMKNFVKMSKAMQKKITVADLLTPEGLTNLRRENPDLFSLVKSRYGAASPKIVQDYNPYSGEMSNLTFARVKDITHNSIKGSSTYIAEAEKTLEKEKPIQPKKMNVTEFKKTQEYNEWNEKVQTLAMRNYLYDIGGARMQSFSDFMIENVFDYVQIVADLAANKFPMHTYTKEIVMMRLFGMSGMKMNGSLICHVDKNLDKKYAGLLPASEASKGNAVLVKTEEGDFAIGFDDYSRYKASQGTDDESYIQSIGYKDIIALQLDKRYSPYVGNIAIGVSDLHIKAMLDSDLFRMVIPYHASGMLPQFAKLVGVDKYNDYTDYQNTTVKQCYDINGKEVARFKKGKKPLAIDTSYPFNAELKRIGDPKIVAENYVKWCAEKHEVYDGKTFVGYATFSPKFSNSPYGTDFSTHPNYYKLLEDFDVYDSVTGEYAEQSSVNMVFPSADNRLSESELAEYREKLESKGIFTEKEIDKYVAKANMTFEEIIKAELDNRSLYESTQSKKYEDTINEISDALLKNHPRSGQITSYKDFRKVLTEGTDKQKREQKGKLPLKGTYDVPNRLQYSTKRDADYMTAVENGDMETAQRMVDEAAKSAGYTVKAYHGTSYGGFTVFDTYGGKFGLFGKGSYFTDDKNVADSYQQKGKGNNKQTYSVYLSPQKTLDMDANANVAMWQKAVPDAADYFKNCKTNEDCFKQLKEYCADYEMYRWEAEELITDVISYNMGYDAITHIGGGRFNRQDATRHRVYIVFEPVNIKSADPVTYDDDGNIIPLSMRFDESNEDIRYATKRESDIEAYWAETVRENHSFRNIITLLGEMEIASGKTQLDSKDIDRIARDIVKSSKSKYDVNQLSDQLTVIYDYMENGKYSDNDEIYIRLLDLAKDVLNQTEFKNTELYEQYKDVREYIRNTPIYITPNVKAEIESQFGSYNTFRRMLMGKAMRLTTTDASARTLDEVWKTLAEYDEGHFPSETNELDMPVKLVEFFDSIAPTVYSPYAEGELSLEDESVMLALDMYQQFYSNVKRLESVESKYKNLVYENMRELEKNKKALVQQFKNKSEENFEEYKNRLAEYKRQREQGDRRRVFRNEFNRSYNYVSRRLERETDRDHIPENLKGVASAFVGMIPDNSQRFSESKLARFENEYRKLKDETTLYDDDMPQRISALAKRLTEDNGMPRMRDLDMYELEEIKNIANHIKYIIQSENELFSERIKGRVEDYAVEVHNELLNKRDSRYQGVPDKKYFGRFKDKNVNIMDAITKGLTKPEYLFSNLGSETLYNLYKELRRGENTEGRIIDSAKNFEVETKKKYKYDSRWDTKDITIDFGDRKLKITTAEAMSLYATSKRKQGLQHMLGGGVVIYAREEVKKNSGKTKDKLQRVKFVFREEDISKLHNALTKNQKDYADAMVGYITNDIGAERNKVSMILHGIEKYKESFYFPIKVDKNYIDANLGKQEVVSTIQNQSSAKRTNKYANNPIEIKNFNEVINEHIYDSALYCAYALPVNDFRRVYNYKSGEFVGEGAESLIPRDMSIQNDIRRANGINTVNQIKDFMVALDSGSRYENLPSFSAKMTSKMKKASTMASLSVVVQQPTAVFRAMLYINPKHFVTWATKKDIAEMKKYNGCALKKQVGYFDVNMGRTVTDYLNEYTPAKDVLKDYTAKELVSNSNIMMKVDQLASFGAEKADEMTWGAIWNACKKQVKSENSSLEGEALYQAAADLFQDVIAKTQVYDSVFTKPDYMRRKEGFAMMTTSFMSEPLTTLNMLVDSVANAKDSKESKVKCARAFGCFVTSLVVNNMLKALVYSMRDDDDDESYLEKYVSNVLGGMVDDVFGMFPYVRDIVSIIKGYDVTRMDTQAFSTLVDSIKVVIDEDKGGVDKVLAVLKAVGQLTGVPAYNIARDAKAIVKIADRIKDGIENGFEPTTSKGVLYEIQETFEWIPGVPDAPNAAEQVIESYLDGDTAHYQKQKANMLKKYDGDATEVKKQLSRKLGDMYKEGKIDKKDATRIMRNTLGKNQKEIDKAFKNWEESKEKAENE